MDIRINTGKIFSYRVDANCFCEKCNSYHLANERGKDCFPIYTLFNELINYDEPIEIRAKDAYMAVELVCMSFNHEEKPISEKFKVINPDGTISFYTCTARLILDYEILEYRESPFSEDRELTF